MLLLRKFNSKKKKKVALIISIFLFIVGLSFHLKLASEDGFKKPYTVEPLALRSKDGTYINAFKYTPKGEKSHGGIVVSHYLSGSKLTMHPLSTELVKRGFTVINLEFHGHGASSDPFLSGELINDMKAAVDYLRYNVSYITEIGLVGHSLGARVAFQFAKAYPDEINATVMIGRLPPNGTKISNLLMAIGSLEQWIPREEVINTLRYYTGQVNVSIGELYYGDFKGGNNIKAIIGSFSEHYTEPFDPTIIYETVQWFEQAFNGELAEDVIIRAPISQIFSYLTIFGVIAISLILITYLSKIIFRRKLIYPEKTILNNPKEPTILDLLKYYTFYSILLGLLIYVLLAVILSRIIIFSTSNIIMLLIVGIAFGTSFTYNVMVMHRQEKLSIKHFPLKIKEMCRTNPTRSIFYGIIASLLIILSLAAVWHTDPHNIMINLKEMGIIILLTLVSFPFFLIKEFYFRNVQGRLKTPKRYREYLYMVSLGIFMDIFLILMTKFITWLNVIVMPFYILYLSVWIYFSIIQNFFTTWVYMWSGRNILGSTMFLSIFYAWISVIFFPSIGFL
ncbi:MAG: dienelactone hydrolase family protein [Promethearchaeota archaeon]